MIIGKPPVGTPPMAPPPAPADGPYPISWPRTQRDQEIMLEIGRQEGYYSQELTPHGISFHERLERARFFSKPNGKPEFSYLALAHLARVHLSVILAEVFGNPIATEEHWAALNRELTVRSSFTNMGK